MGIEVAPTLDAHGNGTAAAPTISLIVPVYNPVLSELADCIESVIAQGYQHWELCLALDGPQSPDVTELITSYDDDRIRYVQRPENGGISAASNSALELATGEFIGLLDNDDTLADFALERVADTLNYWPDADFIYSDEDKLDQAGRRVDHFPKPAWSPERLRSHMYTGHFSVYLTALVRRVGGFRPAFDGSQDHDLALRVSEIATRIIHIPEVLYHWRMSVNSVANAPDAKPYAYHAGVRAVQDQLDRLGIEAVASSVPGYLGYTKYEPLPAASQTDTLVSIIIPTAGTSRVSRGINLRMIDRAIRTVVDVSTYEQFEIVVAVTADAPPSLDQELVDIDPARVRVTRSRAVGAFAETANHAAATAAGDYLVYLAEGCQVLTANWIERMLLLDRFDGVGAVGCRVDFEDGRLQMAGMVSRDTPKPRGRGAKHLHYGLMGGLQAAVHNMAVVGGPCLGLRRSTFLAAGGFSRTLPNHYFEADLCYKLIHSGYRNVLDMHIAVTHNEPARTPADQETAALNVIRDRWFHLLENDPFDNPTILRTLTEENPPPPALTRLREWRGDRDSPRAVRTWPVSR